MKGDILEVVGLKRRYRLPREHLLRPAQEIEALAGIDLAIEPGKSLGIVGESGAGKSTLARAVMGLEPPTEGSVRILGKDLATLDAAAMRALRRHFQMVFQDPYGSLDPRQKVARIVAEPLAAMAAGSMGPPRAAVDAMLDQVGLRAADGEKYPHEFSGGQRQRIAIARALITRPKLIVADEPVSALDVSVQAQVLNLFADLRSRFGMSYLFISHDLAVVDHLCDEVAVIYRGRIVEQGAPSLLFSAAGHPYTRTLIAAVPRQEPGRRVRERRPAAGFERGPDIRSEAVDVHGCAYAPHCAWAAARCRDERPRLRMIASGHSAACHFAEAVAETRDGAAGANSGG